MIRLASFRPLNAIQWINMALAIVLALGFLYGFAQIQDVQHHQNDALHSIICRAEHVVKTQPDIPPKKRREALKFYVESAAAAHLDPCP